MMKLVRNKEKSAEFRKRAEALVTQMTLEEKVLQTLHATPAIERLGIKAYNWWNEALHGVARAGVATIFPQAIGLAATFDENFIEEIADAISTEGRAKFNMQQKYHDTDIYKGLTFWAPNVNIFRDPRWGRGHETFGEDPYLSARLGTRFVEGIQGHDENYLKAAACAKHFAVHSGPEDIRHEFDAISSTQDLYETYLPAFKACVQEGNVEAVMGAYNRTNGEPCCGSKTLLQDILRDAWGFEGHVVSDCWAIKDFHEHHHVTNTPVESVSMAMNNGCDLNCGNLFYYLEEAVKKGMVEESRLDEAVVNLFTTRMKLGVFDKEEDVHYNNIPYSIVDSKEMRQLNKEAAKKSLVLMKNENNILPLKKENIKTLGVIGPNANNRRALVGNYEGTSSHYITILDGLQDYLGEDTRIMYSEGCHLHKKQISGLGLQNDRISEVKGVCAESDIIIACMGLDSGLEGEEGDQGNQYASGDKADLQLPGLQEEVLKVIHESGKPAILILLSGSALAVNFADENISAVIQGFYPGSQTGSAIAELLFGEVNPEGKLPVTFYRTTDELPEFTDYTMKGRTYRYMETEALYPFGYGLSYTDYQYSDLKLEQARVTKEGVTLHVNVTNGGELAGVETVQVYVKFNGEHIQKPNAQLKGIIKVPLKAKEEKKVEFNLPVEAFGLYDEQGVYRVLKGDYTVFVGGSQPDVRSEQLTGKKVDSQIITAEEVLNI
jgi:Beta-glucosidase-related glycosidases